jgi:hypothetical protein
MDKRYRVWTWADSEGKVRFIGMGRIVRGVEPYEQVWNDRYRDGDAAVHVWLRRTFIEMPIPKLLIPTLLNRATAEILYTLARRKVMDSGTKLLTTRPLSTFRTGGGRKMALVEEETNLYFSGIREAARFYGVNAATIQRRVKSRKGWRYFDGPNT